MTPKQEAFVNAYLVEQNATKAAKAAGYSEKTAYSQGQRLLKNVEIARVLESKRSAAAEAAGITAAWVLQEQQALHSATKTAEPEVARKCLRDIGEHLGMYVERVENTNTNVTYVVEAPVKFSDRNTWQRQYSQN